MSSNNNKNRKRTLNEAFDNEPIMSNPSQHKRARQINSNHNNNLVDIKQENASNSEQKENLIENAQKKKLTLKQLSPWMPPNWIIEAKITYKAPVSEIIIRDGSSKSLMHILLTDSESTTMKMTFWEEDAIKYDSTLQKNDVISIEKAKIQNPKNPKYAFYGDIELVCQRDTSIKIEKDTESIFMSQIWDFIESIKEIKSINGGDYIDICGVAINISDTQIVQTKRGPNIARRTLDLVDESAKIRVTLWKNDAQIEIKEKQVIAIKKAKVDSYLGRGLNVSGYLETKPQHTQTDELRDWIKQHDNKTFAQILDKIKSLTDNINDPIDWTTVKFTTINQVKHKQQIYRQKQVLPEETRFEIKAFIKAIDNNLWFHKKDQLNWKLKMTLEDEQQKWLKITAWEKVALKLFNDMSASEAQKMQETKTEEFAKMMNDLITSKQQYTFSIQMKENAYFTPKRLDFTVLKIEKC